MKQEGEDIDETYTFGSQTRIIKCPPALSRNRPKTSLRSSIIDCNVPQFLDKGGILLPKRNEAPRSYVLQGSKLQIPKRGLENQEGGRIKRRKLSEQEPQPVNIKQEEEV